MRTTYRLTTAVVAAAVAVIIPATAFALPGDGGGEDGGGYTVEVEVSFSGDGSEGDGGTYTVSMPAACHWIPLQVSFDPSDPERVKEYWEDNYGNMYGPTFWPEESVFDDAIDQHEDGQSITWYQVECEDIDDMVRLGYHMGETTYNGDPYGIDHYPFVTGDEPAPAIDPEDLAEEARDRMVIEQPEIDRNPQMTGALAGATLVRVPTWFWVTNPEESIGGTEGERTVRAEVVGGDVWAEVTARTGGLSIASPAGGEFCDPSRAITPWSPGASEAGACYVQFSRASVAFPGGYPVSASTEWSASWEGVTQNGEAVGGDLDPLSRSTDVNVPVAEIQSVVGLRD